MTKSTGGLCKLHTIFATALELTQSLLLATSPFACEEAEFFFLSLWNSSSYGTPLNFNGYIKLELLCQSRGSVFSSYPVIAGYCLINDMSEYECAFSQENFSVVAFWQELI